MKPVFEWVCCDTWKPETIKTMSKCAVVHYFDYSRCLKNRICHLSLMQTEKSQPDGNRIMPEPRITEFAALSVDPGFWISRSASETDDLLFFLPIFD